MVTNEVKTVIILSSFEPKISFIGPDGTEIYTLRSCNNIGNNKWSVDLASSFTGEHLLQVLDGASIITSRIIDVEAPQTDFVDSNSFKALLAKIDGNSIEVNTNSVSVEGLPSLNITIIQGSDWNLEVNASIPEDAELEFLLKAETLYGDIIQGTAVKTEEGALLTILSNVTSSMSADRYMYNFSWVLGGSKTQVLRGIANIQKSVII